jgi:hypothetical protein
MWGPDAIMADSRVDAEDLAAMDIVRYLSTHTGAADTLEGIARWWLARQRYEDAMEIVERAVATLVKTGVLREELLPDGTRVYRHANLQTGDVNGGIDG